jgi:hypothetical protein
LEPEPAPPSGYQTVVTRVRDGFCGEPPHDGVDRELSTKVIVVVATPRGVVAPATVGKPADGSPAATGAIAHTTAQASARRRIGRVTTSLLPDEAVIVPTTLSSSHRVGDRAAVTVAA